VLNPLGGGGGKKKRGGKGRPFLLSSRTHGKRGEEGKTWTVPSLLYAQGAGKGREQRRGVGRVYFQFEEKRGEGGKGGGRKPRAEYSMGRRASHLMLRAGRGGRKKKLSAAFVWNFHRVKEEEVHLRLHEKREEKREKGMSLFFKRPIENRSTPEKEKGERSGFAASHMSRLD